MNDIINNFPQSNRIMLNNIRMLFYGTLYCNSVFIQSLIANISKLIECSYIDFDYNRLMFNIKIKKTIMKKHSKFVHNSIYYYGILPKIIQSTLIENEEAVINVLLANGYNYAFYRSLLDNPVQLLQLIGNVICINSNIIEIYL